jgi:hypothetical protein
VKLEQCDDHRHKSDGTSLGKYKNPFPYGCSWLKTVDRKIVLRVQGPKMIPGKATGH